MAISKVDFGGRTLIDLTADTVDKHSLKAGYTAHGADGELVEGTYGKGLSFAPGTTLSLAVELRTADGETYSMADGETLELHMWHGAETIDASSATLSVEASVPADAACRYWHWTLTLVQASQRIMVALGDARCFPAGTGEWSIVGVVDSTRKVQARTFGWDNFAADVESETFTNYVAESATFLTLRAAKLTTTSEWCVTKASALRSVELPLLASIGALTIANCNAIASLELPALTTAGQNCFHTCSNLKCVELPSATSLGGGCFNYCRDLRVIALPGETLCELGGSILYCCPFFTSSRDMKGRIYVNDALVDDYKAATNWATWADYIRPISEWDGSIPESKWDGDAPEMGGGLCSVSDIRGLLDDSISGAVYDETVIALRNYALASCKNVTSVEFPSVATVGSNALLALSVESVTLPSASVFNGSYTFADNQKLALVDLPKAGNTSWGMFTGCTSLTAVILRNPSMTRCNENSELFRGTPIASGTGYIYVPAALLDQYKAATNWSVFADQFRAIEDYPDIYGE